MLNTAPKTKQKKLGLWDKLKLRGRLLTIMLAVALAAVLICAVSFVVMNNRMLVGVREDARNLSESIHSFNETQLIYMQETFLYQVNSYWASVYLDGRLAEAEVKLTDADWRELLDEVYELTNYWLEIEYENTVMFIKTDEDLFTRGLDKEGFVNQADLLFKRLYEEGELYEECGFIDYISEFDANMLFTKGEGGMILAWVPLSGEDMRVGLFIPNTNAMFKSERLRELIDVETAVVVESMTNAAWRSLTAFGLVIAALLIILPFTSRRLALVVVNPVEQEQERQRDLLSVAEEEKAMLERLDRLKTEFLGNVSHELKTPLTVMSGYAQYSQKTLAGVPEMEEVENRMKLITSEADRLALMVTQILDVTKIEEGRMTIDPRPASVVGVIQRTLNTYYPVFTKNNNTLKIERSGEVSNVLCDVNRVSQVLVNLIANAAKHTRDGLITVSAGVEGSFAVVTVADNGEGIAPDRLPFLFERFKSYDSEDEKTRAGKETGTGLGLYISKYIIDAHGGEITIDSAIGVGTAVRFTLPLET